MAASAAAAAAAAAAVAEPLLLLLPFNADCVVGGGVEERAEDALAGAMRVLKYFLRSRAL